MAELYRFFRSVDGDRRYTAKEWADYFNQFLTSGVYHQNEMPGLKVDSTGESWQVCVEAGSAYLEGYMYKNTDNLYLEHDSSHPILNRIDRVVLRLDTTSEERRIKALVLKGEPAEEAEPPVLTREFDEDGYAVIFELSLAQVYIPADTGSINPEHITDERLDEELCGLVSSLITVPTHTFQHQWQTWFNTIKKETYLPRGNLKEGFVVVPEDNLYFFPASALQKEQGWPVWKADLEAMTIGDDKALSIHELEALYQQAVHYNVISNEESHELWNGSQLAIPFSSETEAKYLEVTLSLKRVSLINLNAFVCAADSDGMPDYTEKLGDYNTGNTSVLPTSFEPFTFEFPLNELLTTGKTYYLVIHGVRSSNDRYVKAEYAETPGVSKYLLTTDEGATWSHYERTPYLEINGKPLVNEGSITISFDDVVLLEKHALFNFQITDHTNSFYEADIYDLNDNLILQNIDIGSYLFDLHLDKNTKLKIRLLRAENEEPKLINYEHVWVSDTINHRIEQAILPSDRVILEKPQLKTRNDIRPASHIVGLTFYEINLPFGGRYRVSAEVTSSNHSYNPRLCVLLDTTIRHPEGTEHIEIARAQYNISENNQYSLVTVDLDAVPPNSKILINVGLSGTTSVQQTARIRNLKLCGSFGLQKVELFDV